MGCKNRLTFILIELLFLLFSQYIYSHKSITYDLGFYGFIPGIFDKELIGRQSGTWLELQQKSFPQRDFFSFPWISQGFSFSILVSHRKFSFGGGYDFFFDYYTFDFFNQVTTQGDTVSGFIQNNIFYTVGRLNLKHNYKTSIFLGLKLGINFVVEGYTDGLSTSSALGRSDFRRFSVISANGFSPSLYVGLQLGFKLYIVRNKKHLNSKPKFGIKVISELFGSSPTIPIARRNLNSNLDTIVRRDNNILFSSTYSGITASIIFFLEFPKTKGNKKIKKKLITLLI